MTGQFAGATLCGAPRQQDGVVYVHAMFAPEWMLTDEETCANCREEWRIAGEPEYNDDSEPECYHLNVTTDSEFQNWCDDCGERDTL